MMIVNISFYILSVDCGYGVYGLDKFLVKAYSQMAREVNGATGDKRFED